MRYSTGSGRARNVTSFPNLSLSFWIEGGENERVREKDLKQQTHHVAAWTPPHLVEDVRYVLLGARLLRVAQLGGVFAGQETLVSHESHALIGHLISFKVHLVVWTTCTRTDMNRTADFLQSHRKSLSRARVVMRHQSVLTSASQRA